MSCLRDSICQIDPSLQELVEAIENASTLTPLVWVRLRYRSVTQYEDFRTLDMLPTGSKDEYQAAVPGDHLDPKWDFMYLIEVMDNSGNGAIYPDLEMETPYVVVPLERDTPTATGG